VRLLDIASGPGRYLVETIHALRDIPISAVLRDYKPENLEAPTRLANELAFSGIDRFLPKLNYRVLPAQC